MKMIFKRWNSECSCLSCSLIGIPSEAMDFSHLPSGRIKNDILNYALFKGGWFVFFGLFFLLGCESDYSKSVKKELASGVVHDSLIFDFKMGMTKKEFFTRCWELNSEKLISQGSGNGFAKYFPPLEEGEDETLQLEMLFYGIFDDEGIMRGMDMRYSFTAWAPWNTDRHSDALIDFIVPKYMERYPDNEFIEIELGKEDIKALVKVDGNRRILIYPLDTKDIVVKIEDLRYVLEQKEGE